jgi:hypothetical protein
MCLIVRRPAFGSSAGYSAVAEKRFGYDKPIRGTLFAKMILPGPGIDYLIGWFGHQKKCA